MERDEKSTLSTRPESGVASLVSFREGEREDRERIEKVVLCSFSYFTVSWYLKYFTVLLLLCFFSLRER